MHKKIIRLSRSIVGRYEAEAVSRIIISDGYLGMGGEVDAFEEEIAKYLRMPRQWVVCVNSGTAALQLAVETVTDPGDEVLVQSLTYLASFQAISAAGAVPVACDVVPETITIDLEDASKRITGKTRAIMPVHYASNPGDLDAIYEFAYEHGLRVIEDAAHAFGCSYKGHKIGSPRTDSTTQLIHPSTKTPLNYPDIVCFSFDGIKNITSGEGGAVVTSDKKVAAYVRDARLLGVQGDTEKRYQGKRSWEFEVLNQGYRYHMSNIMAAVGRVQLERFEKEFKPRRIELAQMYRTAFKNLAGCLEMLDSQPGEIVPHIFPIRVLDGRRDSLRQFLIDSGIECGIHYKPNHLLSYYGAKKGMLPVTEKLYEDLLSVPLHPGISDEDVGYVVDKVKEFF